MTDKLTNNTLNCDIKDSNSFKQTFHHLLIRQDLQFSINSQTSRVIESYREKERFITSKAKCRMTGMKLKVNKVIRKCSSIRYFVKNLELI
jgi:hypothetical protein